MTRKEQKQIERANYQAYRHDFKGLSVGVSEMSLNQIRMLSDSDLQEAWRVALSQPATDANRDTVAEIEQEMSRRDGEADDDEAETESHMFGGSGAVLTAEND